MGTLVDKARKTIVRLNWVFFGAILFIEMLLLLFIASTAFYFAMGNISIFSFVAVALLLIWVGLLIAYYAWGIYFYNINLGQTNESWAELKEKRKTEEDLAACKKTTSENAQADTSGNLYKDQSLGLPPGTIRGTLALTLMIGGLSLFIYSMNDPQIQEGNSFIFDNFEFFKTAFLMMIAFYFGSKSLEILRKNNPGGFLLKPGNSSSSNTSTETTTDREAMTNSPVQEQDNSTENRNRTTETPQVGNERLPLTVAKDSSIEHSSIDDETIKKEGEALKIEPAALKAVIKIESGGSGFLPNGQVKILFEGHIFWRHLASKKAEGKIAESPEYYAAIHPDIVYKSWTREFYLGGEKEYARLEKAMLIDRDSAYMATSWGKFQILGENYQLAGFNSVSDFVEAQKISEYEQLKAFIHFISNTTYKGNSLLHYLQSKDWSSFARAYNGPAYAQNQYDVKLEEAYDEYSKRMNTAITATLKRVQPGEKQTLGELSIQEGNVSLFSCKTLELPWKNNQRNVSCIPTGTYKVVKRISEKYGNHFHLLNVPDRSMILIHSGNYYHQTQGCILVGSQFEDINRDGITDIKESRLTLQKLDAIMPDQFELSIS